jgi:glycosyltransferase involved in cell wall biosynthesis
LHVVLNGTVFPDEAVPAPTAERPDDIVFLGGEKPFKGAFDCLGMWSALHERGYQGRLHWFGEIEPNFLARIDALPARDRILLYGRQPRLVIFQTAARCKAFLMLSRVEPFGMATIECIGMGCLAVAWDIPTGTKEIVRGGAGYFAPLGDFDALAGCVLRATRRARCTLRSGHSCGPRRLQRVGDVVALPARSRFDHAVETRIAPPRGPRTTPVPAAVPILPEPSAGRAIRPTRNRRPMAAAGLPAA